MISRPSKFMILIYTIALIHIGFFEINEEVLVALCFILLCWAVSRPNITQQFFGVLYDRLMYIGKVLGKDSIKTRRKHLENMKDVVMSMNTLASDIRNTIEYGLDTIMTWKKTLNKQLKSLIDATIEEKLNVVSMKHSLKSINSYELLRFSLRNAILKRSISSNNIKKDIFKAIRTIKRKK